MLINSPCLRVSVPGARLDGEIAKATSANERHRRPRGASPLLPPQGAAEGAGRSHGFGFGFAPPEELTLGLREGLEGLWWFRAAHRVGGMSPSRLRMAPAHSSRGLGGDPMRGALWHRTPLSTPEPLTGSRGWWPGDDSGTLVQRQGPREQEGSGTGPSQQGEGVNLVPLKHRARAPRPSTSNPPRPASGANAVVTCPRAPCPWAGCGELSVNGAVGEEPRPGSRFH